MKTLTFQATITDRQAAVFEPRDLMVTPVSDGEAASIGAFHVMVGEYLAAQADDPKAVELLEGNRIAMAILERSIRISQGVMKGTIQ